jgi:hypothetical protein
MMSYEDFLGELGKAGLSVRGFADLLGMNANSISNNAKRGEVPSHLAIIAALLATLHGHGIAYQPILSRLGPRKKKPRGRASLVGAEKQGKLELGS